MSAPIWDALPRLSPPHFQRVRCAVEGLLNCLGRECFFDSGEYPKNCIDLAECLNEFAVSLGLPLFDQVFDLDRWSTSRLWPISQFIAAGGGAIEQKDGKTNRLTDDWVSFKLHAKRCDESVPIWTRFRADVTNALNTLIDQLIPASQTGGDLPKRAKDILRLLLKHNRTSPDKTLAQDEIARRLLQRSATDRRSISRPIKALKTKKLITTCGRGCGSGTYLTPLGAEVAGTLPPE